MLNIVIKDIFSNKIYLEKQFELPNLSDVLSEIINDEKKLKDVVSGVTDAYIKHDKGMIFQLSLDNNVRFLKVDIS